MNIYCSNLIARDIYCMRRIDLATDDYEEIDSLNGRRQFLCSSCVDKILSPPIVSAYDVNGSPVERNRKATVRSAWVNSQPANFELRTQKLR